MLARKNFDHSSHGNDFLLIVIVDLDEDVYLMDMSLVMGGDAPGPVCALFVLLAHELVQQKAGQHWRRLTCDEQTRECDDIINCCD